MQYPCTSQDSHSTSCGKNSRLTESSVIPTFSKLLYRSSPCTSSVHWAEAYTSSVQSQWCTTSSKPPMPESSLQTNLPKPLLSKKSMSPSMPVTSIAGSNAGPFKCSSAV